MIFPSKINESQIAHFLLMYEIVKDMKIIPDLQIELCWDWDEG